MRPYIKKVMLTGDMIVHRSHERQFQKLIVDPIRSVTRSFPPMVIVVDAIDECNGKQMMANLISIIRYSCISMPPAPPPIFLH
jgi:hypothetical protein